MFTEGDMAEYPAHGVGVIKAIQTQKVGGLDQTFYVLEILENNMTIMIPTSVNTSPNTVTTPELNSSFSTSTSEVTRVISLPTGFRS